MAISEIVDDITTLIHARVYLTLYYMVALQVQVRKLIFSIGFGCQLAVAVVKKTSLLNSETSTSVIKQLMMRTYKTCWKTDFENREHRM